MLHTAALKIERAMSPRKQMALEPGEGKPILPQSFQEVDSSGDTFILAFLDLLQTLTTKTIK